MKVLNVNTLRAFYIPISLNLFSLDVSVVGLDLLVLLGVRYVEDRVCNNYRSTVIFPYGSTDGLKPSVCSVLE